MQEQLKNDEKEWAQEYADIPSMSTSTSIASNDVVLPKEHRKLTNMSDFSGYLSVSNSDPTELSIGRFFLNRCQELHDFLPKSPMKNNHKPMPLIPPNDTQLPTG